MGQGSISVVALTNVDPAPFAIKVTAGTTIGNGYIYPIFGNKAPALSRNVFISCDVKTAVASGVRLAVAYTRQDGTTNALATVTLTNFRAEFAIDPATSQVIARGSVTPSVPDNSFSYTSTTTTINITWPNITIYRADGTSITISSGSQNITTLTAATTYKVYPYAVDNGTSSGTMSFVLGGSGAPTACFAAAGNAQAAATMSARGNIPLNGFQVATPAAGSGGGGGGGSVCYHEANMMLTERGWVKAGELTEDDSLPSPTGWQKIKWLRREPAFTWIEVACGHIIDYVVPEHVFYKVTGEPITAGQLRLGDLLKAAGNHVEITGLRLRKEWGDKIMTELEDPHLYYGGNLQLEGHNPKP